MLESYFGTTDSGSKTDLSADHHSEEIRTKVHSCCAAAKMFTVSAQCNQKDSASAKHKEYAPT
jgi:hypothetical protein